MVMPRNGLSLLSKPRNNLQPLYYTDSEVAEEEHVNAPLTTVTFGFVHVWVLSRLSLVNREQLSLSTQDRVQPNKEILPPIQGKAMQFLPRVHAHHHSVYSPKRLWIRRRNCGCLGRSVLWVASIEMGNSLSPEQVGRGCSSMALLHDWEIRCAMECLVYKCHRMRQQEGVNHIHYGGNCGHRQEQTSLVKGWSYVALDKNDNSFVYFLCTDIAHATRLMVLFCWRQ